MILFVAGYAGSGKTMVGKIIASKLHASYIDKDTLYRRIIEKSLELTTGNPYNYTSDFYNQNFKRLEYEGMLDTAIENAKLNPRVVVTGPFTHSPGSASFRDSEWTNEISQKCKKIGADWHAVWVFSSNDAIRKMLELRKAPRDDWKLAHWEEYTTKYRMNKDDLTLPFPNHTIIRNDGRNLREIEADVNAMLAKLGLTIAQAD